MRALAEACASGAVKAVVGVVVAPADGSRAVTTARELGLTVEILPSKHPDYARRLLGVLRDAGVEWVCLAGYMRLLPIEVLQAFPDRVLNIHPALLPKFGGKGMYGMHVHEAVLSSGETESGCTVHLVNERYDEGRIVLQKRCPVEPGDTPEALAARVLDLEHVAYPEALALVIGDRGSGNGDRGSEVSRKGAKVAKGGSEPVDHTGPPVYGPAFVWVFLPLLKLFAGVLLLILGPLRVRGKTKLPRKGAVLILANHLADIDPIAVQVACRRPVYFMAKSELFEMRILGPFLRWFKAFPVRRGEPDKGALKLAVAHLRAGHAVCLFPEGQLSETGELQELKAGVGLIVRMAGAPVQCVGLSGTQRMMPYGTHIPRPAFHTVRATWGIGRAFDKRASNEEILGWVDEQLRTLSSG